MRGFIDLHSHWVAGVDDGAKNFAESAALLAALRAVGFDTVIATPHMRPGMFDNTREHLSTAYEATCAALRSVPGLPALGLSSEHFFDDVVYQRLLEGRALPYPGGHAALVEFPSRSFPVRVTHRFFDLRRRSIRPVLAHPERYEPVFRDRTLLDPLIDGGALLLLDVAALAGKYGRAPRRAAEELLEEGYYYAACSDAHQAKDVVDVEKGIAALFARVGPEEATFLLAEGPRSILDGQIEE
ncbi:tyrosine-protein phosphatase [Chondromyces apiculatus]|uniref:protein-tyrosine-phosphatase n=1 Tax=Chondromyces apiculatus DSM 436 TaxID=1192034 RepID=A0A017TI41_9BACT|nr:CpsB/CapC family capsule biosynthesis tyrosine phosphatase [Chondromyces apiculatus]EYF08924.1 Manganese-dependent protein-tyrosine phosphatase [Chondromyces apiculatus DSM 436]